MSLYEQMTDAEVLERAKRALLKASSLPPRSTKRGMQMAVFDDAMAELARRALKFALRRIHEQGDESCE